MAWLDFVSNFINGLRQAVDMVAGVPARVAEYCSFLPSYFLIPFLGIVSVLIIFRIVQLCF